jgi:hypothetical protein
MDAASPMSRKRKSVGGDGDTVMEQSKPLTKRGRKKVAEIEKEHIVPVTDYSKCEFVSGTLYSWKAQKINVTLIDFSNQGDLANRSIIYT